MLKHFEAMKVGKLSIQSWLSCPYDKNMLVDLPSSVYELLPTTKMNGKTKMIDF